MTAPPTLRIVDHAPSLDQAVIELILAIQADEFGFALTAADQPDLADVANVYQVGAGGFWVAMVDDEPVGTIALLDLGNGNGALRKMFVKAGWRGREHGVAARLLQHLLAHACDANLGTIWLGTTERFLAAHRFYEKNGFEPTPDIALPTGFPRMAVDTRFYRRDLP